MIDIINQANDLLWGYVIIAVLVGCGVWFTVRMRFVQFRMLGEMVRLLNDSPVKVKGQERHISSFQAFTVSLASRIGTGNLAGVATAIVVGGPGAVFWMWVMALFGAATAFVESTLGQLYKAVGWQYSLPFSLPSPSDLPTIPYKPIPSVELWRAPSAGIPR